MVQQKEQLQFETLITDISAQFVNLPAEQINATIKDAQQKICECLGLDQSSLWQWTNDESRKLILTHLYSPPPPLGPEHPGEINAQEEFPWVCNKTKHGETFVISTDQMPPEASKDQEARRFFGVKSSVIIPLSVGKRPVMGALCFDDLQTDRTWSSETVARLTLIAQVFSNALERKRFEEALFKSEARLNLAADSAEAGIWEYDCNSKTFWATGKAREIFGYDPDESVTMATFESSIIADDRDRIREAMALSIGQGEPVNIEYRIEDKDGHLKWILSRGRSHFLPNGEAERLAGVSIDITSKKKTEEELKNRIQEVEELKQLLDNNNVYLRKDLRLEQGFETVIGNSKAFSAVTQAARQVAMTDATVLILGETGTGKGLIANTIYQMSNRKSFPFMTVNCTALPHNLIESELFGREKGAFTGAHANQIGRFEAANGGTIFLDEIGDMPIELQSKLLRVLQDGEFERLGSSKTRKVDVRVIAATSRDLKNEVRRGHFREDLFYRLNVFPIEMPPLRQRADDIPLLAWHFLKKYANKMGRRIDNIPDAVTKKLIKYKWPGNVRELEHIIERGVITTPGSTFQLTCPLNNEFCDSMTQPAKELAEIEREHILRVLRETGWKIGGPGGASELLKLNPSTLRFRIKKMGISRPA